MFRRRFLQGICGLATAVVPRILIAGASQVSVGVIGGGIVGASIAFHLAKAGAAVKVFEKTTPASGATCKSFAWINAFSDNSHYRDLRLQSLTYYHQLDKQLQLDITWGGSLTWKQEPNAAAELLEAAKVFDSVGYSMRALDIHEFAELAPNLRPGPFEAAIYASLDGHLDPILATHKFLDHARRYGAEIHFPCEVTELEMNGEKLLGVTTTTGKYQLDRLVIAGGVDTPLLTTKVDYIPPLRHAPGILAHTSPIQPLTRAVIEGPTVHFKQLINGRIVGADSTYAPDIPSHRGILQEPQDFPNEEMRTMHGARILDKIAMVHPDARNAVLEKLTLGFRPMPIDGLPIVGFVPGLSDIYVAVMHSGITLAPKVGELVSQEILGDVSVASLTPYRPSRFS